MSNPQSREDKLEELLDSWTLETLLNNLADICRAKAEHIRANWQDERTASYWDKDAKRIESMANGIFN